MRWSFASICWPWLLLGTGAWGQSHCMNGLTAAIDAEAVKNKLPAAPLADDAECLGGLNLSRPDWRHPFLGRSPSLSFG